MSDRRSIKYGFIKPAIDAHTMGVNSASELLRDCGYDVIIADDTVEKAVDDYRYELRRKVVVDWVITNKIDRLGISYRLDQDDAMNMIEYLIEEFKKANLMKFQGGQIETIFFGGLPKTCEAIEKEFNGLVTTFIGGESVRETLLKMGVSEDRIPRDIYEGSKYDELLMKFGKEIIDSQEYTSYKTYDRSKYLEYGTRKDTVIKRVDSNMKHGFGPLMRAHVGPYSSNLTRVESVNEFLDWAKILAKSNYLDILSIGTSQLTQSNFGEDWEDKPNGGGVPVNSPEEYRMIWETSRPLLVRTYAGSKGIPNLAQMYEETLNISWHALSLWWFNKLDGRGPYDLYTNLQEHIETIKYIAKTNKPFEANVPHHFAFRGADDVTYIVSAYLAAKLAKGLGIKTFILQNMLNTPRLTWGIQDLAKSRAVLKLVRSLEDTNFRVLLQPRAGLDYFKPDLYEAKIQLAAVTALMDDIDPYNEMSPQIIHVVSYSEASHLATPEIINESIQITQHSLQKYRDMRKQGKIDDMGRNPDVNERSAELYQSAKKIIQAIESNIDNPYSAEGFYKIFAAGFLPVPYLWSEIEEFKHAKNWKTKPIRGSVKVVDENNKVMDTEKIIEIANSNLKDAEYNLRQRQIKNIFN
ncbi:MAG: cobalamin-binding protein [Erysipelotrichia bacterium]|nr:cobalamin-binding protein [Erysipelotrichia bacterium]